VIAAGYCGGRQEHLSNTQRCCFTGQLWFRQAHQPCEWVEKVSNPLEDRGKTLQQQANQANGHDRWHNRARQTQPVAEIDPNGFAQAWCGIQSQQSFTYCCFKAVASYLLFWRPRG